MTSFSEDVYFSKATFFAVAPTFPDGWLTDDEVKSAANIAASKLEHRAPVALTQAGGSDVVSETRIVHVSARAGRLAGLTVRPSTAPTGGDKQYTVDVQRAVDGSAVWVTLLQAVLVFGDGDADDTKKSGVLIADPSLSVGDAIRIVITATGSTGSQGQGVIAVALVDEAGT